MAMPMEHHNRIIVESYVARKTGSKGEIRVRPIAGQLYPTDMQVQFSRQARNQHPIGTKFLIYVKESDISGGTPFLQSPWQWHYEVLV